MASSIVSFNLLPSLYHQVKEVPTLLSPYSLFFSLDSRSSEYRSPIFSCCYGSSPPFISSNNGDYDEGLPCLYSWELARLCPCEPTPSDSSASIISGIYSYIMGGYILPILRHLHALHQAHYDFSVGTARNQQRSSLDLENYGHWKRGLSFLSV